MWSWININKEGKMRNNKHKDWFFYAVHYVALSVALAGLLLFIGTCYLLDKHKQGG